jgi:hypothetical protein
MAMRNRELGVLLAAAVAGVVGAIVASIPATKAATANTLIVSSLIVTR